ncbi:MAG: hypothetical protein JWM93_1295 [Frankiales bacterium]|nr:hypothetical protein [Frankiales bacterium]
MSANNNELAEDVREIARRVAASSKSNRKWDAVGAAVAESIGLEREDVYVTTVGLVRNVAVRLTQSRPARRGRVGIVMWTGADDDLERAVNGARGACDEIRRLTLVFAEDGDGMGLVAIIKPSEEQVPEALAAAYPAASVMDC